MYGYIVVLFISCLVVNVVPEALSGKYGSSLRTVYASVKDVNHHWFSFDPIQIVQDQVDKMRGEMCWLRGDIIEHEDCMEWLVPKCRHDDFGVEYCERLKNHVREECLKKRLKACHYAHRLGLDIKHESSQEEQIEENELAAPPASISAPSPAAPQVPPSAPAASPKTETTLPEKTDTTKTVAETTTLPAKEKTTAEPKTTSIDSEDEKLIPAIETTTHPKTGASHGNAIPGGYSEPKPGAKLQSQGFSGKKVRHEDGQTYAGDWQNEYGHAESSKHAHSRAWRTNGLSLPFLLMSTAVIVGRG
jgi:hypothetical protein